MSELPSPRLRGKGPPAERSLVEADDETLAHALTSGDPRAAWVAWHRFAPLVHRTISRRLSLGSDVDDLLQQVFIILFRRIGTLQKPHALKAFVVSITLNVMRKEARQRRIRKEFWRNWRTQPSPVHPDPEAREALARFCRILEGLGPADATAFMLRFVDNRDLVEVASLLGVSLSTVKRKLTRIWQRFAVQVERDPALCCYLLVDTSLTVRDNHLTDSGRLGTRSPSASTECSPA